MTNKRFISWQEVFDRLDSIDLEGNVVYGVPKGGMIASAFLRNAVVTHFPEAANIILDDVLDSGKTAQKYKDQFPTTRFYPLIDKKTEKGMQKWLVFPWEMQHPNGEDTVEENIMRQLQYIGEDTTREGLVDTPKRVVKSWKELFKGYNQDPKEILTVFESGGYDQIVLLKDIEMYSMCEHHMLPFFGKAHVAYIPDQKVIGISKLARLVDVYARRLQIQERIGDQVTKVLMEELHAKGAACIIEAKHMCMCMRGVGKQNSVMTTSSMVGVFRDIPAAREELMQLIRK